MSASMNIYCHAEGKVIGTLPLPISLAGGQALTHRWVCANFQPVSAEYQVIPASQRDGETMRCPRCYGELSIEGAAFVPGEPVERKRGAGGARTRAEVRAEITARNGVTDRVIAAPASPGMAIVLGSTRVEVKP